MANKNRNGDGITIQVANENHLPYINTILETMESAAKARGTGIARRSPGYIRDKMKEGKAIIALDNDIFAGFCYIESWSGKKFVANSGLIVAPGYRGHGLARRIKEKAFALSREKFPDAKIFGLTTSLAVMKINTDLGYKPVTFSMLTDDEDFWKGCEGCVNHDILMRTGKHRCLCTAMLYDPAWEKENNRPKTRLEQHSLKVFERWLQLKRNILTRLKNNKNQVKNE